MRSPHELNERINALKHSQHNGCDNNTEIEILTSILNITEEQIGTMIKTATNESDWTKVRILSWVLEPSLNI